MSGQWKKKPPYQEIYWGDFFSSTMAMQSDAAKAYLFLLGRAWEDGGYLRDDDDWLARASRCSTRLWNKVRDEVLERFEADGKGHLFQRRLLENIQQVNQKREKLKQNSEKRWSKKSNEINDRGDAIASKLHVDVRATPAPAPAPASTELDTNSEPRTPKTEPHSHLRPSGDGPHAGLADQMVEIWNEIAGEALPKARPGAKSRRPKLTAALRRDLDGSLDQWRAACHRIAASSFLCGATGWTACGIDWVIKAENMVKILEGNYDDKKPNGPNGPNGNGANRHDRSTKPNRADVSDVLERHRQRIRREQAGDGSGTAEAATPGRGGARPAGKALDADQEEPREPGGQGRDHGSLDLGDPWFENEPFFDENGVEIADQDRRMVARSR